MSNLNYNPSYNPGNEGSSDYFTIATMLAGSAYVLYQYRRTFVRENKSNCCPTLTANMGSGGHNVPLLKDKKGIRKLTPRECFNLQGFPRDYKLPDLSDSALYHLAGNAVSVPVVKLIVDKIINL